MLVHAHSRLQTALVGLFWKKNDQNLLLLHRSGRRCCQSLQKMAAEPACNTVPDYLPRDTAAIDTGNSIAPAIAYVHGVFSKICSPNSSPLSPRMQPQPLRSAGDAFSTGSVFEQKHIKIMCGQDPDCNDSVLPFWYSSLF